MTMMMLVVFITRVADAFIVTVTFLTFVAVGLRCTTKHHVFVPPLDGRAYTTIKTLAYLAAFNR